MTDKELREHIETINTFLNIVSVSKHENMRKAYVQVMRNEIADIIEAYKDLQGRIKNLAEKQELSYKEHIKKES